MLISAYTRSLFYTSKCIYIKISAGLFYCNPFQTIRRSNKDKQLNSTGWPMMLATNNRHYVCSLFATFLGIMLYWSIAQMWRHSQLIQVGKWWEGTEQVTSKNKLNISGFAWHEGSEPNDLKVTIVSPLAFKFTHRRADIPAAPAALLHLSFRYPSERSLTVVTASRRLSIPLYL